MLTVNLENISGQNGDGPIGSQDLETRVVKSFADITILRYLKSHPNSSGYQVLRHMHMEYGVFCSPGTIYQEIYRLERRKLVEGESDGNARVYSLTDKGTKTLLDAAKTSKQITGLISNILSLPQTKK